jgi:hypothetical protein
MEKVQTAGYSGTPLAKKLGIKPGIRIRLIQPPDHYFSLFSDFPGEVDISGDKSIKKDLIHFFTKDSEELGSQIQSLRSEIFPNGVLWISWPKKSSNVKTDITEDVIRNMALVNGLVDVKVCAVDEIWSGLKLVVPVKERK